MTTTRTSFAPYLKTLLKHVGLLFFIIGLFWIAWNGWQAYSDWNDQPLPADRVSAKQIRINESQRQALVKDLATYHAPTASAALQPVTFQGGATR